MPTCSQSLLSTFDPRYLESIHINLEQQLKDIHPTNKTIRSHIVLNMVNHTSLIRHRGTHVVRKVMEADRVTLVIDIKRRR